MEWNLETQISYCKCGLDLLDCGDDDGEDLSGSGDDHCGDLSGSGYNDGGEVCISEVLGVRFTFTAIVI